MTNEQIGEALEAACAKERYHMARFADNWSGYTLACLQGNGVEAHNRRAALHEIMDDILDAIGAQQTLISRVTLGKP